MRRLVGSLTLPDGQLVFQGNLLFKAMISGDQVLLGSVASFEVDDIGAYDISIVAGTYHVSYIN